MCEMVEENVKHSRQTDCNSQLQDSAPLYALDWIELVTNKLLVKLLKLFLSKFHQKTPIAMIAN